MELQRSDTTLLAGRKEWIGLSVLALPALLVSMDMTVMYLALPTISVALHPTSAQLMWITDIYNFLEAGLLITMGTLGDRIGRRRLLLSGAVAFALASALSAFSSSAVLLIAARGILGMAGATLLPSSLSLIRNMFHNDRQRTFAMGVWTTCFSCGTMLGPLVGGFMLSHFWWGSVFLMGVPVMGLLITIGPSFLPEFREPVTGKFDLSSAGLSIVATLAIIYGIKQIAAQGIDWLPVVSIVAGLAVGTVFIKRQQVLAHPLIDLALFRIKAFTPALLSLLLVCFGWGGIFLFIAQHLQLMLDMSPLQAGLWTIPSAGGGVIGSMLAPQLLRVARRGYVMAAGMVILAIGLGMFSLAGGPSGFPFFIIATMLISGGCGITVTLGSDLLISTAPPGRAGAAAGLSETGTTFGLALGVAILGCIGTAFYHAHMADTLSAGLAPDAATAARSTLGEALAIARQMPGATGAGLLHTARMAFADAFAVTAGIAAALLVLSAIIIAFLLRKPSN
jgi:DHA2 family multidrug resistance protein-like MFS transporter